MAKVKILIDKHGNPKILDVSGAGQGCLETTKNFEKALGEFKEENRQLTESYYEELPPQTLELEGG